MTVTTPPVGWAVVTGASDGIGRAYAFAFAAQRRSLVLVARRGAVLQALVPALERDGAPSVRVIAADLATQEGIAAVIDGTSDLDVDTLVAAAGFGTAGSFLDLPIDREIEMLAVNCRAPTALAHAFGQRFRARGGGSIILLSSLLGFAGVAKSATYAATKGYIQMLAEALRDELAPFGVVVQAVAPGPTHSGFAARAGMRYSAAVSSATVATESLALLGRRATVRPGWLTKVLDSGLRVVPRRVRSLILGRVMGGMVSAPPTTAS